jgi:hypothetical protein
LAPSEFVATGLAHRQYKEHSMQAITELTTARKPKSVSTAGAKDDTRPSREAIAVAAYYRAEKRGFTPGGELQDWFEAERALAESSARP